MMRFAYFVACVAAALGLMLHASQAVNVMPQYPPLRLDFSAGLNPLTKFFRQESGTGAYYTGASPNRLTDSSTSHWIVWALERGRGGQQSGDGHAIIRTAGATAQTTDHNGIVVHASCDYSMGSSSNSYLVLMVRGEGLMQVWETTGADLPGISFDTQPCSVCQDTGPNIGGNDYVGFQWEGTGDSTVVRVWNFQDAPPSNWDDWTTWGTCDAGIYDTASATTCTANLNVNFAASGYDSGTCVGLMHHDGTAAGLAGLQLAYFSK